MPLATGSRTGAAKREGIPRRTARTPAESRGESRPAVLHAPAMELDPALFYEHSLRYEFITSAALAGRAE